MMKKIFPPSLHLFATLAALLVSLYFIFIYAPQEATMGEVQRIFYIHVSSAWTAMLAYFLVFLGSIAYVWKRQDSADDFAYGAAEVGFIFCSCVLVTGPLWAKPVWGIWWTWDERLTPTFFLWLLFVGYLMLRSYVIAPGRAALLAAVVSILGVVDAVFDFWVIRMKNYRGQHPGPVMGGGGQIDPRMWVAVFVTWAAFLLLFSYLVRQYMRVAALRREVARLRQLHESSSGA